MGRASAMARLHRCASVCIGGEIFLLALPRAAPVCEGPPSRGARQNLMHQTSAPHRRVACHEMKSRIERNETAARQWRSPLPCAREAHSPLSPSPWDQVSHITKRDGRETVAPRCRNVARPQGPLIAESRLMGSISRTTKRDAHETPPVPNHAAAGPSRCRSGRQQPRPPIVPPSIPQPDRRDLVPDRPAAGQRAAPVAEEAGLVLQRVHRDAGHRHPGGRQPGGAIARQVELPARLAPAGGEEPDVGAGRAPAPRRAGRRRPRRSACRMQGPMAAAIRRAPSACMAATVASSTPATAPRQPAWAAPTTPAVRVAEQHRRAVGGDDAQRDAGPVGHHGVGAGALAGGPGDGRRAPPRCRAPGSDRAGVRVRRRWRGRRGRGSPARRRASPGRTGCSSGWHTGRRTRRRGG